MAHKFKDLPQPHDPNILPCNNQVLVIVSNLKGFSSAKQIYNLLGYFGDVSKILYLKNKFNAMVQFSSLVEAQKCISSLNK